MGRLITRRYLSWQPAPREIYANPRRPRKSREIYATSWGARGQRPEACKAPAYYFVITRLSVEYCGARVFWNCPVIEEGSTDGSRPLSFFLVFFGGTPQCGAIYLVLFCDIKVFIIFVFFISVTSSIIRIIILKVKSAILRIHHR